MSDELTDALDNIFGPDDVRRAWDEDHFPHWEGDKFIECGDCRIKPGTPALCKECLLTRAREPKKLPWWREWCRRFKLMIMSLRGEIEE